MVLQQSVLLAAHPWLLWAKTCPPGPPLKPGLIFLGADPTVSSADVLLPAGERFPRAGKG